MASRDRSQPRIPRAFPQPRFPPFAQPPFAQPRDDDWEVVIKVKYGDTLRRFAAQVHGRSIDHNLSSLRAKIINLFKFRPEAVLTLTYTDEDGDTVALDEDEELLDAAVTQRLNPLRINVQLKGSGSSDPKTQMASSTQNLSQQIESILHTNPAVAEVLKSVPEPIRAAVTKISQDILLKASSIPALAEVVEHFSNLGLTNAGSASNGSVGASSGTSSLPTNLTDANATNEHKSVIDPTPENDKMRATSNLDTEHDANQKGMASTIQGSIAAPSVPVDLNLDPPRDQLESELASLNDLVRSDLTTKLRTLATKLPQNNGGGDAPGGKLTVTISAPADQSGVSNIQSSVLPNPSIPPPIRVSKVPACDINTRFRTLPTLGVPSSVLPSYPVSPSRAHTFPAPPSRAHTFPAPPSTAHIFHRGVQCDGCGMYPITGPRFKSIIKEDYDLCRYCFSNMGSEADYTRIEKPAYHCPFLIGESFKPHGRYGGPHPHIFGSVFIKDVTVIDGTVMRPCTPFTKIWRMRNNGTIAWPFGTHLLWTGGNPLGNRYSCKIEVAYDGLPVGQEIDVAVDLTSPSEPGSYTSIWRLATTSGKTFGQQVWVQIEVENPQTSSVSGAIHRELNLNLPAVSSERDVSGLIDMSAEPSDGFSMQTLFPEPWNMPVVTEPKTDSLMGASDVQVMPEVVTSAPPVEVVPEPALPELSALPEPALPELSALPEPALRDLYTFPEPAPEVTASADLLSSETATAENSLEQAMLKELQEMGFMQIDLNKEVLRQNEYNLEQCVDDLCDFAEWDPLLSELQGMGFNDKARNKKLLVKNNGSIKRVVLDLISGEKDE